MQKSSDPNNSFDAAEGAAPGDAPTLGGADAVQKTTWVVGEGTDPDRQDPADEAAPARGKAAEVPRPEAEDDR